MRIGTYRAKDDNHTALPLCKVINRFMVALLVANHVSNHYHTITVMVWQSRWHILALSKKLWGSYWMNMGYIMVNVILSAGYYPTISAGLRDCVIGSSS